MKIRNVTFDKHKILGSATVDFSGGKDVISEDDWKEFGVRLNTESKNENEFTYIIGPNGVGKTVFFRTLIDFLNVNSPEVDERLEDYISLFPPSKEYEKFRSGKRAEGELLSYGVYDPSGSDILDSNKAHLIYITSAIGSTPIHKNPRYRSFNYLSDINKTKSLLIRALNRGNANIDEKLNTLIEWPKQSVWKITGRLMYRGEWQGVGEDSKYYKIELADSTVNIRTLIAIIKKIILIQNRIIQTGDWTDYEKAAFKALYDDSTFFKFFFDSGLTIGKFIAKLKKSIVFKTILNLFEDTLTAVKPNSTIVYIEQTYAGKWEMLFKDVKQLSPFDCELLIVLDNLKLVDIHVTCDDLPIHLMSSGEQTMLRLFSFFSDLPIEAKNKNLLVFFDEPENTLHPKWQQNFHANFTELITKIYKIKHSHFIISTHSPLIIMKTNGTKNTQVLQFSRTTEDEFTSQPVKDINAYSIEEVMLDDFNISYRDKVLEVEYNKLLKTKSEDPMLSIKTSFDLKEKIQAMFDDINNPS